jgi:hypothetical protein
MMPYIFVREDVFYMIDLRDDADACANAECNPGTVRVESHDGRVVWPRLLASHPIDHREDTQA